MNRGGAEGVRGWRQRNDQKEPAEAHSTQARWWVTMKCFTLETTPSPTPSHKGVGELRGNLFWTSFFVCHFLVLHNNGQVVSDLKSELSEAVKNNRPGVAGGHQLAIVQLLADNGIDTSKYRTSGRSVDDIMADLDCRIADLVKSADLLKYQTQKVRCFYPFSPVTYVISGVSQSLFTTVSAILRTCGVWPSLFIGYWPVITKTRRNVNTKDNWLDHLLLFIIIIIIQGSK